MEKEQQIGNVICAVMTGTQGHSPGVGWGEEILTEPVLKGEWEREQDVWTGGAACLPAWSLRDYCGLRAGNHLKKGKNCWGRGGMTPGHPM